MRRWLFCLAAAAVFSVTAIVAQQPVLKLTANSVNVSDPGSHVRIEIFRWSTDQERSQLVTALTPPPPPAAAEAPPAAAAPSTDGAAARGGRGAARGGAGGGAAGGRGGARGGRGGGGAEPRDPIAVLTAAIDSAPTIGYIWTNEITGYSIKHASRLPSSDGTERIILATNRRLGANSLSWTPVKGTPTPYSFTVLEIRLPSNGSGEARTSLTANVAIDNQARSIALENYAAATNLLESVRRSQTEE